MRVCANAVAALVAATLLGSSPVAACPFCDGGPLGVNPVKVAIFGDDFWSNLLYTAAPFGVFLTVAAFIHFGLPTFGGQIAGASARRGGQE